MCGCIFFPTHLSHHSQLSPAPAAALLPCVLHMDILMGQSRSGSMCLLLHFTYLPFPSSCIYCSNITSRYTTMSCYICSVTLWSRLWCSAMKQCCKGPWKVTQFPSSRLMAGTAVQEIQPVLIALYLFFKVFSSFIFWCTWVVSYADHW